MKSQFIHLRLHTEYSLVDGVVRIKPLMKAVRAQQMPAVALTDQGNLFALVKFYRAALETGVKPILGVDVWLHDDSSSQTGNTAPARLVLLCQNDQGYHNLTALISRSYSEGQQSGIPVLNKSWLFGNTDGLIALSGAQQGDIGRALLAGHPDEAQALLNDWLHLFPNRFYLELQRTQRENEERYIREAVKLATQANVPVVATNDVRFIEQSDFEAHEARVCIHDGRTLDDPRRPRHYSEQQYLKSPEEMSKLFADIPSAISNTVEIAKRCTFILTLGENHLPQFPVPDNETIESYFKKRAQQGLEKRLEFLQSNESWPAEKIKQYHDRLELEINVIVGMGFPGYFLIVADFIHWSKRNGIPVGPGRGSGAGSLVAYALDITDLDPIEYELLFERFLNPERVSLPDFDVDFCMEGRDRVIEYVTERYGIDKVSQIITYGTMAAKAVVRDVGRVLGHPYGFVDRIAKLIPFEIGMTLKKALDEAEDLKAAYDQEEEVTALIDLARSLEGLARNAGKHAGGVVIAPSKLTDFTPLYREQDGQGHVTQLDKNDVEAVGLVKFDFLGLRTLTIIDWAVKAINQQRAAQQEDPLEIERLPLNDQKTFDLLQRQQTTAVFQLESRGMKDLIKRLKPDCFDEIVALVALFRPGPLQSGMVDDFINRKHGAEVHYAHPDLEPILNPTYGVILYQEQVMQIAQVLAGYTLGAADMLRRAMGKKKAEEMAEQRTIFTEGATARGVKEQIATYIFDLMEKFAGYGFNKSHSAAYALLSYQTAWLKAHYPAEFMAAVLSSDMDNTDKVVLLINECKDMAIDINAPDINRSYAMFTAAENAIQYGLGAIKGVGSAAIDNMIAERTARGEFKDIYDFCQRVDSQKVNKRVQEALIRCGALDALGENRATLMAALPDALAAAEQAARDQEAGQVDIFGDALAVTHDIKAQISKQIEWDDDYKLAGERETLGFFLSGHPVTRYRDELLKITGKRILDQIEAAESKASGESQGRYTKDVATTLGGLVMSVRSKNTRNGKMGFLLLDDDTHRVEVVLRPEDFKQYENIVQRDKILIVEGDFGYDDFSGGYRVRARKLYDIDEARQHFAKCVELDIDQQKSANGFVDSLYETLKPYRNGVCPVTLHYRAASADAQIRLGDEWNVMPSEQLIMQLRALAGEANVRVVY